MKAVLVIIDGMADRSQESLGWKTPLQVARTPNLDQLASVGSCGHMYSLGPGVCASSDQAHWQILGYGTFPYPGRAGIEAIGAGIPLEAGDVIVRANLATTVEKGDKRYVQVSPSYLPDDHCHAVAASLSSYPARIFKTVIHHMGGPYMLLVLRGGASKEISDSDPLFPRQPVQPIVCKENCNGSISDSARNTALELECFSQWAAGKLESNPLLVRMSEDGKTPPNDVLLKWSSVYPEVPPLVQTWGFKGVIVASGVFYAGLAQVLGMDFKLVNTVDSISSDLRGKLEIACQALQGEKDFALVHTKAVDEASHTGKPAEKVHALEEVDTALEYVISTYLRDPEITTMITADHPTPSNSSDDIIHSGESVPLVMLGRNTRRDQVETFDEVSCSRGALGLVSGSDVMPLILNLTNRARFGTMQIGRFEIPYRRDESMP